MENNVASSCLTVCSIQRQLLRWTHFRKHGDRARVFTAVPVFEKEAEEARAGKIRIVKHAGVLIREKK